MHAINKTILITTYLWWVAPDWMPGAHQSHSVSYLLSWVGEINLMKGSWVDIRLGRDHSPVNCHGQNKLDLRKLA